MEQSELLRRIVEVLEGLGLRYFVTGSVATIFYGEPRLTNDIDVVVALPAGRVKAFCREFPLGEYYLSEEDVREAVVAHGQFNIIHPTSGLKIDVMIPPDTPFNRGRFTRVGHVRPTPDYEACFASPEDVIIKKMEYFRAGGSDKHIRDIKGVIKVSGAVLDHAYIREWAARLDLIDIWRIILEHDDERE